ncbi:putative disease resistance protein RGA1 [Silene latifolia]|uniref:putative disease resistance protein RGA1 n=1 Tax=Silene latifolia TaxID=37657 RepID=UPI003D77CBA1
MAAEWVVWENLKRTLNEHEITLLLSFKEAFDRLRELVTTVNLEGLRSLVSSHDQGASDDLSGSQMGERLKRLSTLLHEADDLLDQILTFVQRPRLCGGQRGGNGRENWNHLVQRVAHAMAITTQEVSLFVSSSNQLVFPKIMARRVKKVSDKIQDRVRQFANELDNTNQAGERRFQPIEWTGLAEESIIGRENDKKKIIDKLLQPPKDSMSQVPIIYMSGLPGVGKSALAKEIYEDVKVKSHFDLRMWIPVSNITDDTEIIREIVEACTKRKSNYSDNFQSPHYYSSRVDQNDMKSLRDLLGCQGSNVSAISPTSNTGQNEIDIYERRLRKEIKGKHYLLILDDLRLQIWQRLRHLLAEGGKGCQILVTARLPITEVADLVNDETLEVQAYPLEGLEKKHSWTLFKTLALDQGEPYSAEMKKTGLEIADICKHLPLTIKIAARFLHGRNRNGSISAEWSAFRDGLGLIRDQQVDVMEHVLYLTCSDLPTRLRVCFGYCSLFPNHFTFNKHDLIDLWIAQGFVNPQDGQNLEEIGEKYFLELVRRCLFEEVTYDELGNILCCKMHHIVCSIASNLTVGVTKIPMTDSRMIEVPDPTPKHVSVNCRGYSTLKFSSRSLKGPSMRTLIFIKEPDCEIKVDKLVCNQLISSYRRLRVLDLQDLGIKELPDSIGDQIHLRYLDLSKNEGLVTIPKSFTRLYNLQTLKLNSCSMLKLFATDFGVLNNLKRFEIDDCDSLTCMPLGLEKLTQLETLNRFVVGKRSYTSTTYVGLKALSGLIMLRGRLAIEFTGEWLTNILEAKPLELAGEWMRNTSKLNEVKIRWARRTSDIEVPSEQEISAQEMILERLQPNSNLKILCIEGYRGRYFPSWANVDTIYSSLPNLVIISIEGCGECKFLPPFGELQHLRKLTLRHMTNVLYFESPAGGREEVVEDRPLFTSLQELTLHNFFNLKAWQREVAAIHQAEPRPFPSLSTLRIWNCPNLSSLPSFPKVTDLKLRNVNQLLLDDCARKASSLTNTIQTRSLQIKACPNLKGFEVVRNGLGGLPSLKHLVIERCDALSSLASDLKNLASLERLKISSCKELDLSKDTGRFCRLFPFSPWKKLKCLRELTLIEIPKMETLPEGLKHVTTLKLLWISACQSLGSLPEWISSLIVLQHLRIESCRALKRLPKELKDVQSLIKVEITECPELMERCREHTGEDWSYIKHARVLLHKSWRYGYVS